VAQNQAEQMFETRPHIVEDPYAPVFIESSDEFACRLSRPGKMTEMATAVYASATRAAPYHLLRGARRNK